VQTLRAADVEHGRTGPQPVVRHAIAREVALETVAKANTPTA
jgi:hypothetical protein